MKARRWLQCLCSALVTICFLILPAEPSARAESGKSKFYSSHFKHGYGKRGINRRYKRATLDIGSSFKSPIDIGSSFKSRKIFKRHNRSKLARRFNRRVRYRNVPTYYYDRDYGYRDNSGSGSKYRSENDDVKQPYQTIPVTPKWVHVGDLVDAEGPSTNEGPYVESRLRRNCLYVKTEITIDGQPIEAFGNACLQADGSWQLVPSKPTD